MIDINFRPFVRMNQIFSIRTKAADNQLIMKAHFFKIGDLTDKPKLTIYIVVSMAAYVNIHSHD